MFDDTPGQLRTQLSTTQYATGLTLGHLKQQTDSARQADRGHGAELTTQATGAVRAGQGLLLTTEAGRQQLSAAGAIGGLSEAHQLTKALSDAADQQQAIVDGDDTTKDRTAINALNDSHESASATAAGTGTNSGADEAAIKTAQGGAGDVPAWSRPDLIAREIGDRPRFMLTSEKPFRTGFPYATPCPPNTAERPPTYYSAGQ